MTTNEIKAMFDAAGVIYTQAEQAEHARTTAPNKFISIKLGEHGKYLNCPCYHDTFDDAYQCIWAAYIENTYN